MCQVFSTLLGHLQFFVHFFFTFMEYFFIDHPISTERVFYNPSFLPFARKLIFLSFLAIFHHLYLLIRHPFIPRLLLLTKNVITGCCCNDIYRETVYYHPIFPPFSWKLNFGSFLAIFYHLYLLMGHPMTPSPL